MDDMDYAGLIGEPRDGAGSLQWLYDMVPEAEEHDLLEQIDHESVVTDWFRDNLERMGIIPKGDDDPTLSSAADSEDQARSEFDDASYTPGQRVGMIEHLLGGEELG